MKFSYRANKFLELQKQRGDFWVDKLGATEQVNQITFSALVNKQEIAWHKQSSNLLRDIFQSKNFKNIFFCKSMIDKAKLNIDINKSLQAFRTIRNDFGCVILNNKNSFIYGIYQDKFIGIYLVEDRVSNIELISYLETGFEHTSLLTDFDLGTPNHDVFKDLIPLLTLYHFAEIETKIIEKNKQRKANVDSKKFVNDTEVPVQIINSNWFVNIIKTEGFKVRGHLAFRAYGKGRKERKLVWINPYEKNGYTRKAKLSLSK